MKSLSKSCELDPVPTSLMKQNIDVFAKYITIIVNRSLSSGCFPDSQKIAHVKPLLKKPNLDKEVFKNYRLVANLKYLGKTIERVVSSRISDHVHANNLSDTFQSAYKPFHGTETALLRVNNDILSAMDDGKITTLDLLDLSTTCDEKTVSSIWIASAIIKSFSSQITPSSQAQNLGVIFDSTMTRKPHISNIVRVSSFHIRNIS